MVQIGSVRPGDRSLDATAPHLQSPPWTSLPPGPPRNAIPLALPLPRTTLAPAELMQEQCSTAFGHRPWTNAAVSIGSMAAAVGALVPALLLQVAGISWILP